MKEDLVKLSKYLKRSGFYLEHVQVLKLASAGGFSSIQEMADSLIQTESELQNYLNQIEDCDEAKECSDEEYDSLVKSYDRLLDLSNNMLRMFDKMPNIPNEISSVVERISSFEPIEGHTFVDRYKSQINKEQNTTENTYHRKEIESPYNSSFKYSPCEDSIERGKRGLLNSDDEYLSYIGCLIMGNPTPEDVEFIYNIEDLKDLRGGYAVDPDVSQVDYSTEDIQQNYKTLLSYKEKIKLKNILTNNKKDL